MLHACRFKRSLPDIRRVAGPGGVPFLRPRREGRGPRSAQGPALIKAVSREEYSSIFPARGTNGAKWPRPAHGGTLEWNFRAVAARLSVGSGGYEPDIQAGAAYPINSLEGCIT